MNTHGANSLDNEIERRLGDASTGYAVDGCIHGTSGSTTVAMASCETYIHDTSADSSLKFMREPTSRDIVYSGGNGTYWLYTRWDAKATPAGLTCTPGSPYCWLLSATRPTSHPDETLLIGQTTVAGGAITAFVSEAPRKISKPFTITSTLTTGPYAVWEWDTPGGIVTVASGQTLRFGACPQAGRHPLWTAVGGASGLIKFALGACKEVNPEWWGIDPSGVRDDTATWAVVFTAASATTSPNMGTQISCAGTYAISSTGVPALSPPAGTQLVGSYRMAGGGNNEQPCRFNYTGNHRAIYIATGERIRLENIQLFDVDDTGTHGIYAETFTAGSMRNIFIRRFDEGLNIEGAIYYGYLDDIKVYNSRVIGVDLGGGINDASLDFQINTANIALTNTTLTHGIRFGHNGGSNNVRLNVLVEVHRGIPVVIQDVKALDARVYIEHAAGVVGDFSVVGALQLAGINGGRIHMKLNGNAQGGNPPVGLRVVGQAEGSGIGHTRNLDITGAIENYISPYNVVLEAGGWGLNLSRLHVEDPHNSNDGSFSTGVLIGKSYISHGGPPGTNQGRSSTAEGTNWQVGDLLFAAPASDGRISNLLRQVTVAGNPPTVTSLLIPTILPITAADGDATPSVRIGNTFFTRMDAVASATAITDFDDETLGQCIIIRATGNRTITDNVNILLNGSANFAMNAGDMLHLCSDTDIWREVGRGDNN